MMLSTAIVSALLAINTTTTGAPAWEKVFDSSTGWISAVRATSPSDFIVAGEWGITRMSQSGQVDRRETPGHPVLGLFAEDATSVFALGAGELVLHFDGKTWHEEHVGEKPTKRPNRGEDLLQGAFYAETSSSLIAFGPQLVLTRMPDTTWSRPSGRERDHLLDTSHGAFPGIDRPPKCDPGSWFWLGKNLAWFACQDGRTFMLDAGKLQSKGKKPTKCRTLTTVAIGQGEIYASCANGTLWKTESEIWRAVPAPPDKEKEFRSISVVGECVFLAGSRTVWRSCKR